MKNVVILEDAIYRIEGFEKMFSGHNYVITGRAKSAINLLMSGAKKDMLFLDHDLDGKIHVPSGPGTGWEVCKFLAENQHFMPKRVILHSHNEKGVAEMKKVLPNAEIKSYGYFTFDGEKILDLEEKMII